MKKFNKKVIFIILIVVAIAAILGTITYFILHDDDKLSVEEKEWLAANINNVQNVHVLNNVDVYGKNGSGVFYDFIDSFEKEYGIDINIITYNSGESVDARAFKIVNNVKDNQVVFKKEHYVLISKDKTSFSSLTQLSGKQVGVIATDEKNVSNYLNTVKDINLTPYESSTKLFESLETGETIQYAIVPLEENLSSILTSSYHIDYHISDLNKYFVYELQDNDIFSSIIKKYYSKWSKTNLATSINENELNTFVNALSISDKDLKNLQANNYNYGFINTHPYEALISGTYGGIVSEYLSRFGAFAKVDFTYVKYNNFNQFTEAIANNKIDLFYNYYNLDTKYQKVDSLDNIEFAVVAKESNPLVINSINSLSDKKVYVLKNSILEKYLNSIGGVDVKTYETERDLKKIARKDNYILMDLNTFNYYNKKILSDYNVRYTNVLSDTYNFYVSNNETFNLLFSKYIQTQDPKDIKIKGIYNHTITVKSGTILGRIAKYSLIIIALAIILIIIAFRSTKKIKIAKKIRKEDKIKYIDQLTSLKNRNYLNENVAAWNKNTIYPQATIIVDLNRVQEINDTLGYEKGDTQIKAAANVLIKTQLDNTDIMRTDGNEFLIYLIGYEEKQVVSYIRKLSKEFKKMPYDYGAAIGYSMITNNAKTVEDAINESVEDMRNKKEEQTSEE